MKHSSKIILIEIGIILASLFCLFVFNINYHIYLSILILLAIGLHFFLKQEKRQERFNTEIVLIIIISILFYYAITYFLGFFLGFYYSNYSKSLIGIMTNIIYALIVIISIENIREDLIKNHAYHKSIVYLTPIICCLLEIPSLINFKIYTETIDIFYAFLTLILPSISKNIALTYITYKSNKNSSIIYQLLVTIPLYFLPVFPDFGEFLEIVKNMLLPIIVMILIANIINIKFDKIKNSISLAHIKLFTRTINTVLVIFIIIILYLTSGLFRFYSLAIGSISMTGSINKGDIVIIDKKYKSIKKNDVIAFEEQGKIVVHRVIKVRHNTKEKSYRTKGDYNTTPDGWVVKKGAIVGKVVVKIKWLGWPTVALSELLTKKG